MTDSTVVICSSCEAKNRLPATAPGSPRCARCHQPLPWIADANDDTFGEVADGSGLPVLVDLWAPWCAPCRMVSPLLEELATEFAGRFKLVKVNVEEAPGVQSRFGVQGIPTLLILDRGNEVDRLVGAHPMDRLRAWVERFVRAR